MPSLISRPLYIFVPHCSDLLTDHLPNGDGQIAYGFLRTLAERGHTLHIAASRVEVRGIIHPNMHVHLISNTKSGALGRLEYMWKVRRLFNTLRTQISFDLIHQTNPVFAGISLALVGSGLPVVLGTFVARWPADPHSIIGRSGLKRSVATIGRDLLAVVQQLNADRLLLTSPAARNRLPWPALVERKIRQIGHGVDAELFAPAPDYLSEVRIEEEQRSPKVLFLANIVIRKGIITLLTSWQEVAKRIPTAKLIVVGTGPDLSLAQEIAVSLHITESVEFAGYKTRTEAPSCYRGATLYVLPSFGEPYATSVIEAMSCGRAIVITGAGGLPALVSAEGGLAVPVSDVTALSGAIIELLQNPDQRLKMSLFNRDKVLREMTWPKLGDALEGYYAELLPNLSS